MDFGTYLKTAREERRIDLDVISASTKINRRLLADLEKNDLTRWPPHKVYRRGYVRSYAKAIGLNADEVVRQFEAEFEEQKSASAVKPAPAQPKSSRYRLTKTAAAVAVSGGLLLGLSLSIVDSRNTISSSVRSERTSPHASSPKPQERAVTRASLQSPVRHASVVAEPSVAADSNVVDGSSIVAETATASQAGSDESNIEGEIRISSNPPGAWVTVNDIGYGSAPLRVQFLPLRSYRIRFVRAGYRIAETRVTLTAERPNQTINLVLRADPALEGTRAKSDEGATNRISEP